jgi:hypothetical protein
VRLAFLCARTRTRCVAYCFLVWMELISGNIGWMLVRSSRYGTARRRCCLAHAITRPLSICGLLDVSLQRWSCAASHSSRVTLKSTKSSRSSGQSIIHSSLGIPAPVVITSIIDTILFLICRVLGTPNEELWPGVKQLPDYKPTFPQWSPQDLAEQVPYLDAAGIDLLKVIYYLCALLLLRS